MLKALARRQRLVVGAFFVLLLGIGLLIVRDYGVSIDEPQSRNTGLISLKYIGEHYFPGYIKSHEVFGPIGPPLHQFSDRDYGVAFELPLAWLELLLHIKGERNIFFFRHLCTFLVCFGGVIAVYQLARRRFADWRLGLLGALLLVLSPRLFAESFYNDKDAVFMALFAIATNTAVAFVQRPSWARVGWHALACACTIDVRIMGIILPLATLVLTGLEAARGAYRGQRLQLGLKLPAYLGLLVGLVILQWPCLWEAPLQNFLLAFHNMSKFRWYSELLYAGKMMRASKIPWHYAPVWIGITTPVLYLVGFLVGAFLILRQLMLRGWRLYATAAEWQDLLFLGLTLAPIIAVIALHSIIYDGWRQLYFVYPSLLLVSLRGLVALLRWRPGAPSWQRLWQRFSYATLGITLLVMAGQVVAMHPLQNTYFNILPGRHLEGRFEIDYWVLSYREGLQWIADHDNRLHIKVGGQMRNELEANRLILKPYDRDRLEILEDWGKADYYVTTYRWHAYDYTEYPFEMTTIRRGGQRIMSIFRVKW
jgi:hypothetical protein